MYTTITYIIIGILLLDYIIERGLAYLNTRNVKTDLPPQLKGLYDAEAYAKQQSYFKENQRFGLITSTFSLLLILAMFVVGGFALVDVFAQSLVENAILVSLIFFGVIFFANDLLSIPFDLYDHFVIEQRYGFNKVTPKIFVSDKLKGWILGALIGGGLVALISKIYELTADYFWILAWAVMALFSIFITMFYSQLIVPLFNKQTPLENGELRDEIEKFAQKAGFTLNNIFVMDGSKRSTKANAYFSGLGSKKRIVLFDTLIDELSTQEIVAVLAHEIGHYKKKHTLMALAMSLANSLIMLFVLGFFLDSDVLAQAFGVEKASFHINLLAFGILYTPVSVVLSLFMNMLSRKNEYQADAYAASFGLGENLIEGLKKLSVKSLSNLQPHPAYVFFYHSHPTLLQRMEAIHNLKNEK
ncbi:MAG: M48 family metallopeptidase [Paludibacteraceae bacterium]|nr:M48 family metallopeptidase [Paludibacteraceae bacterium]MBN2786768.1 M48 family metallopeptidase [Paludibacteraceae bacterium]